MLGINISTAASLLVAGTLPEEDEIAAATSSLFFLLFLLLFFTGLLFPFTCALAPTPPKLFKIF